MLKASLTLLVITVVLLGFAIAFQYGRHTGFQTGSEWALVQADILAREAGVFMPVYMKDGDFRVVIRQPRGLYKKAWKAADRYEGELGLGAMNVSTGTTGVGGGRIDSQL